MSDYSTVKKLKLIGKDLAVPFRSILLLQKKPLGLRVTGTRLLTYKSVIRVVVLMQMHLRILLPMKFYIRQMRGVF